MNADDKAFARDWYGTEPVEVLAKKYHTTDIGIRVRAVMVLKLGPRTDLKDWPASAQQNLSQRRKEVGL